MFLEIVRKRLLDAGHPISPRDDVDASAAAWFLGKSVGTLANWRSEDRGPAYVNLGRDIRYPLASLLEHIEGEVRLRRE